MRKKRSLTITSKNYPMTTTPNYNKLQNKMLITKQSSQQMPRKSGQKQMLLKNNYKKRSFNLKLTSNNTLTEWQDMKKSWEK